MSRRSRALLGWALVAAAGIALLPAQLGRPAVAEAEQLNSAERTQAGALYAGQCATCHGAEGSGGVTPAGDPVPPLAGSPDVTVPYVDLVMRVGRMPPAGDPYDNRSRKVVLDAEQRRLVTAYVAEEFDLSGSVPTVGDGNPVTGREVFAANCAQCHGSSGAGGVAGAGAWTPPVVDKDPVAIAEAIRVGPFQMPGFNNDQITDEEIADVAAFLKVVGEEQGTPAGLVELNPVYASGFAALFVGVVVISLFIIAGRPKWFPDPSGQPTGRGLSRRQRKARAEQEPAA
ncbi:MAG: c-type cytochrome [Actinomycetota bacterium]|jgi:ubiquinol-cytochrome c reductase cytochrome c subunit|nr:c-type cytochrome [Actinomycetota bacterium]